MKRKTNQHTLKRTLKKTNKHNPRILLQNYPRDRGNLFNELIPKLTTFPKKQRKQNLNLWNLCPLKANIQKNTQTSQTSRFYCHNFETKTKINQKITIDVANKQINVDFAPYKKKRSTHQILINCKQTNKNVTWCSAE